MIEQNDRTAFNVMLYAPGWWYLFGIFIRVRLYKRMPLGVWEVENVLF